MQNAKDSFYVALRTRLAALNPSRTILLRGAVRPGIVVEEAEAPFATLPSDVFVLRWQILGLDSALPLALAAEECEIFYQTGGSQSFGGLDRGRMLSAMDSEVAQLLQPQSAMKFSYSTQPPTQMLTQVFWDDPVFTPITTQRDVLSRSVKVRVYSYQEPGE